MQPTALIINGAEPCKPAASGRLNTLLFQTLQDQLSGTHRILTTVIAKGYQVASEQEKFLQADLIVFQTPVFWFALPASLKRYIDRVYGYGVFFGRAGSYGRGGMLTGKRYLLSMTWNAEAGDFNTDSGFLGPRMPDDVMLAFHLTQQYVGLQPLASFTEYNVVRNPDPAGSIARLQSHLERQVIGSR